MESSSNNSPSAPSSSFGVQTKSCWGLINFTFSNERHMLQVLSKWLKVLHFCLIKTFGTIIIDLLSNKFYKQLKHIPLRDITMYC